MSNKICKYEGSCAFLRKYLLTLVAILILLLFTFSVNLFFIAKAYGEHINKQIIQSTLEHGSVDYSRICRVSNCSYIIPNKFGSYFEHKSGTDILTLKEFTDLKISKVYSEYYYVEGLGLFRYIPIANAYMSLDFKEFIDELAPTYVHTLLVVYFISILFLYRSYKREEKEHMIQTIGSEAILSNQLMVVISENVHHEMNTPLAVVENKVEKIHRALQHYLTSVNDYIDSEVPQKVIQAFTHAIVTLEADFTQIKSANEQQFATLDKMRKFKHVRYSNGNKTIYDIIEGAVQTISISNSGFVYNIDHNLENYKIKLAGEKTLKNVDLLMAFINHFKNSIEAKASTIVVNLSQFTGNTIKIHIVDNGNGIPSNIKLEDVFNPNFSTKKTKGTVRGNGMFLNKFILETFGGSIKILDTSLNGTIIEIIVPAYYEEKRVY